MIITVRGTNEGIYKQEYDYKTQVSVTQCGLTYKIISKAKRKRPEYYVSYEGSVKIDEINRNKKKITGSYKFILRSIPDTKKTEKIEGKFINLSYN